MGSERFSRTAEWFYSRVFGNEQLPRRSPEQQSCLTPMLRTARSLENGISGGWQSREAVFLKQGKLLAAYEDDYAYDEPVVRYFPTYEALSDRELRGYFSWRTALRKGRLRKTSASYAYLYIYELLNGIGVDTPEEGYRALLDFKSSYGALDPTVCGYLDRWCFDYVIYYGLDPQLLRDAPQLTFERHLQVLLQIHEQTDGQIMEAVRALAPRWLGRSKFYAGESAAMDQVIPQVLKGVAGHYARGKHPMVEQFYGSRQKIPVRLLENAVLYRGNPGPNREYRLGPLTTYTWNGSFWLREGYSYSETCPKLEAIIKTVDAVMRDQLGYGHPIKTGSQLQWLTRLIQAEVAAYLQRQKEAEAKKLRIDYSRLDTIRENAALVREALLVEDERLEEPVPEAAPTQPVSDTPLSPPEYRLLQCLLYGGDLNWVREAGLLLSVLTDGVNEKLYDTFFDTVLEPEEPPKLIEDYISDLKEMILP